MSLRVFCTNEGPSGKKIEHFLAIFYQKHCKCQIHVLQTDSGVEYKKVDLLCNSSGVARPVNEAQNQASNGKAELMHRTVLNMACYMMFLCNPPLTFCGNAVEFRRTIASQFYKLESKLCAAN